MQRSYQNFISQYDAQNPQMDKLTEVVRTLTTLLNLFRELPNYPTAYNNEYRANARYHYNENQELVDDTTTVLEQSARGVAAGQKQNLESVKEMVAAVSGAVQVSMPKFPTRVVVYSSPLADRSGTGGVLRSIAELTAVLIKPWSLARIYASLSTRVKFDLNLDPALIVTRRYKIQVKMDTPVNTPFSLWFKTPDQRILVCNLEDYTVGYDISNETTYDTVNGVVVTTAIQISSDTPQVSLEGLPALVSGESLQLNTLAGGVQMDNKDNTGLVWPYTPADVPADGREGVNVIEELISSLQLHLDDLISAMPSLD